MIRAFIDASVIYAAIISATGGARELLKRHIAEEVQLVVSSYVLTETINNLESKSPDKAGAVQLLVDLLALEIVEIDIAIVKQVATYTEVKDAPVVAAAIVGQCDYLLTFDRKHLLGKPQIEQISGIKIMTPGDLLQLLQNDEESSD
jgi:putative PIN family toxin of toxin-antitoxin system